MNSWKQCRFKRNEKTFLNFDATYIRFLACINVCDPDLCDPNVCDPGKMARTRWNGLESAYKICLSQVIYGAKYRKKKYHIGAPFNPCLPHHGQGRKFAASF